MGYFVLEGKGYDLSVLGLNVRNWIDDGPGGIKYITDKNKRESTIMGGVAHTDNGKVSIVKPGFGPNTNIDDRLASYQTSTDRNVSWDWTIDLNGDITLQNDICRDYSWQANATNPRTYGFEMVQEVKDKDTKNEKWYLYQGQLEKAAQLFDFVNYALGIQRQMAWDFKKNEVALYVLDRLVDWDDFCGAGTHCQVSSNRGRGDAGPPLFVILKEKYGYECFDVAKKEDLTAWKSRQVSLGFTGKNVDGIIGKGTRAAIRQKTGFNCWVRRDQDAVYEQILKNGVSV